MSLARFEERGEGRAVGRRVGRRRGAATEARCARRATLVVWGDGAKLVHATTCNSMLRILSMLLLLKPPLARMLTARPTWLLGNRELGL